MSRRDDVAARGQRDPYAATPPSWALPFVAVVKVLAVFLVWPLTFVLLLLTLLMDGLEWLIGEWYGGWS